MKRMLRVNELIKRELGTLIEREIMPGFNGLITVTAVQTSPDLRNATVFVSIYGKKGQDEDALQLLRTNRVELQKKMAKNVRLKYTPVLYFKIDDKLEKADKIYQILDSLGLEKSKEDLER